MAPSQNSLLGMMMMPQVPYGVATHHLPHRPCASTVPPRGLLNGKKRKKRRSKKRNTRYAQLSQTRKGSTPGKALAKVGKASSQSPVSRPDSDRKVREERTETSIGYLATLRTRLVSRCHHTTKRLVYGEKCLIGHRGRGASHWSQHREPPLALPPFFECPEPVR